MVFVCRGCEGTGECEGPVYGRSPGERLEIFDYRKGWRGPSEPRPRIRCCQVLLVVFACKRKRGKGGTEGALRIWVGLEVTGGVREWPLTRVKEDGQWARIP